MSDTLTTPDGGLAPTPVDAGASPRHLLRSLVHNRNGLVGIVLAAIPVLLAIAHITGLTPYDAAEQTAADRLQGPSSTHLLGTDQFGRDLRTRVAGGVANSLIIALTAVALAAVVGTLAGLVAGFYRRGADVAVMTVSNILFAFPSLLLALSLAAVLERSRFTVAVAIAVVYVPIFVRVVRGPVLSLREVDYVRAAIATGDRKYSVMFRHVLPNVMPIIIVQVTLSLSWAVLTEAALSYLGLGAPPPAPALGSMIFDARTLMYRSPSTMIVPGVVLVLLIVSLNLIGDGLRDVLDPKERGRS